MHQVLLMIARSGDEKTNVPNTKAGIAHEMPSRRVYVHGHRPRADVAPSHSRVDAAIQSDPPVTLMPSCTS